MLSILKKLFGLSATELNAEDLKNGTIIDVRSPTEYQQGHATGSINIPLGEMNGSILKIRQMKAPIITCCRSGNRSSQATSILNKNSIRTINGGTWQNVEQQLK
jgi:rhodanese-related sulfurtransferase